MKEIKLIKNDKLPYSLHDMSITGIKYDEEKFELVFEFKEGIEEKGKKINASIKITKVDFDFSTISILSKNGYYGKFEGEKKELKDFVDENKNFKFEIVDELHGYNMVQYNGFLDLDNNDDLLECSIYIYYSGDYIYVIQ